ncbi:MAG: HAD hydrolase family protein [Lachnospiraceae bacterium]|nr:HAD hydrolase family protein [Lachnospiraceae bacterium]
MYIPNRADIDLLVYDFDGVMTDNRVIVDENGKESAIVNRGDGYGVGMIRKAGIPQLILSTEVNPIVAHRAAKLKISVIHNLPDKAKALKEYCEAENISLSRVLYIGNDLNDYEAMKLVGIVGAPADAEEEILAIADWISSKKGGYGVIRELARMILGGAPRSGEVS